jgi:outer membrane protein
MNLSYLKRAMAVAVVAVAASVSITGSSLSHAVASIGYVDLEKVISDYGKAQTVMADIKVKEADLRKMQADFVKQLEVNRKANAKSPVSSDALEKELNEKLNAKLNEYRDWAATKQKEVDNDLKATIRDVAKAKNVDVVLTRQAVFEGGADLTNDVLSKLNTSASPASAK